MSKKHKKARNRSAKVADPASSVPEKKPGEDSSQGTRYQVMFRELIESAVVALVLAFLFRTFEAEAFVIPTGSMAPTLMGRHKDVECPTCGYQFTVSASEEVDSNTGASTGNWVISGVCPMCRHEVDLLDETAYNGDRILVNKFAYQFHDPERFDVAVFHYPGHAETNYIKRIVGLPGETIRIQDGDLFVKKPGEKKFTIARKTPNKLRAMLRTVYDNDYVMPEKPLAQGMPLCWQPDKAPNGWKASEDWKSFSADGVLSEPTWLHFRYAMPSARPNPANPSGQFPPVDDYCAYNTGVNVNPKLNGCPPSWIPDVWSDQRRRCGVGDLGVQCSLEVRKPAGSVVFELVELGRRMQCRIDLNSGEAVLTIPGMPTFQPVAQTGIQGPGTHEVLFVNADDELRLWVDDKLVAFDSPTTFEPLGIGGDLKLDLAPVSIASAGADVGIAHLKVLRDTYYHSMIRGLEGLREYVDLSLEKDQFLAMGDNSQKSNDSRLWDAPHYVPRSLLIGKALYIYWPHSWDEVKIGSWRIPFYFFPNFERMRLIR
ncbi:MAG: signal peptidase I [Pirellulales bacterium]|nr:signal peptidase I [Pirellulales bacterium]